MRFILAISLLSISLALGSGCASPAPAPKPLNIRLAILDFAAPDASYHGESAEFKTREVKGWWMGSTDHYRSQHVGIQAADEINARLSRAASITTHLRDDYRQYVADKREVLAQAFSDLTDAQLAAELERVQQENAIEIGRELKVDRVMTGRVLAASMTHNRAIHTWKSNVEIALVLWDVDKNAKVFEKTFACQRRFSSLQATLEALAEDVAEWMAAEYGHR